MNKLWFCGLYGQRLWGSWTTTLSQSTLLLLLFSAPFFLCFLITDCAHFFSLRQGTPSVGFPIFFSCSCICISGIGRAPLCSLRICLHTKLFGTHALENAWELPCALQLLSKVFDRWFQNGLMHHKCAPILAAVENGEHTAHDLHHFFLGCPPSRCAPKKTWMTPSVLNLTQAGPNENQTVFDGTKKETPSNLPLVC